MQPVVTVRRTLISSVHRSVELAQQFVNDRKRKIAHKQKHIHTLTRPHTGSISQRDECTVCMFTLHDSTTYWLVPIGTVSGRHGLPNNESGQVKDEAACTRRIHLVVSWVT